MSRPVRVLVDLSVAPLGGAGTYAAGFASGLAAAPVPDKGDIVVLVDAVWASTNPEPVAAMAAAGVVVDALELDPPGTWPARLRRGRVVRAAVGRHRVDVAYFPRDVAPRLDLPYVLLANNLYAWREFDSYGAVGGSLSASLLRRLAARGARRAAAVLAVSRTMSAALPDDIGVAAIVHHGCALPEGEPASAAPGSAPVVVMVGNVIANKGFEMAIAGVAAARRDGVDWRLAVYGGRADEAYATEVEDRARAELGYEVIQGPAYGDQLGEAYRSADIVVVGGTFESFCHPLVEAMRTGCVVVAPACDLVDELCGDVAVTYAEGDAWSLADALAVAWEERVDRSRRGIEAARAFTWDTAVEQTVELVRDAAGRGAGSATGPTARP